MPVSARPRSDGGAVIAIDRAGVEDWIRGECVKTWYGEHTELAERIRAAQMAAHEEERAREAALEEASRAAASLRAKRIDKLTRRNERIIQEAEREQLNKRTSMAVALDNAAVDAATKMGIEDVDVPVEWGRGESDDAGKVLSNPTLDGPGAGERIYHLPRARLSLTSGEAARTMSLASRASAQSGQRLFGARALGPSGRLHSSPRRRTLNASRTGASPAEAVIGAVGRCSEGTLPLRLCRCSCGIAEVISYVRI